ncbi:PREDICTED: adhesion G-protein coupled receptor G2-like [Amphimedon queenslandica]|uniref:G-protein coupled receptors family 2 profile 2 domain-containing protein n=2 Tax=Amphimedon queenslandica TaxID=400682 RepID=A0AAN0JK88_AMPQE|nr:PREDICTED: adhesion G-protein coupled receptor G2-like [Amphimedon queenslandica]|eukprot:XP_019857113.1 PREDICTED: adhesion G-protein coupled receptor G2-like [Amphimedon queenslandica]
MWIGAEAVLMFQKIVIVFTNISWRYILIVSIVCWTIPVVPVMILLAVDNGYYITSTKNSEFCFIGKMVPLLVAFLLPIFLIIIINTIVFIIVIRTTLENAINRKKRMNNSSLSVSKVLKMLLSFIGIMILFGLTWVSAAFTFTSEPNVSHTVQFIFAFFNAFQGFFIFIFFILLNKEYRKPWKACFVQCFPRATIHSDYKSGHSTKSKSRNENSYVISNHVSLNDMNKEEMKDTSL